MSDDAPPTVLFLCIHNAGRSQMALGWFEHLADVRPIRDDIGARVRNLLASLGVTE